MISGYTYTLGTSGNRTRVTENSGRVVNYGYDSLYRLVSEQISDPVKGNENIGYTYDAFGNRLTKTDSSGTTSYVYDANDRLVTESGVSGTTTYSYDANGNTLSKSGSDSASYEYNAENRLVSVNNSVGQTEYQYDASGIRVSSNVNGTATKYLVDKNRDYAQVLEERTGSGTLEARYTYGDDLISQNRSGSSSFYIYDGQLSTRQLTDSSGAVTDTYTYDAFGVQLSKTGTTLNNYRYTGEQFDPNAGFYYLRARYYDQSAGRFNNKDLWDGDEIDPSTLNLYVYTRNNPINYNDPSGNIFSLIEFSVSNAISPNLRKSNDANRAFKAYKNVRKGLCTAAGVTATNAHHAVPMFLGGKKYPGPTNIISLPANFHREFHLILHYMLRMADFPGGIGSGASKAAYQQLFQSNPATRAAAHQVLIMAARIFDDACTKQGAPPITPTIKAQIQAGKWDF